MLFSWSVIRAIYFSVKRDLSFYFFVIRDLQFLDLFTCTWTRILTYAWPVNEELNFAWFVNYLVLPDSISNSFSRLAECIPSFLAFWLRFQTAEPFVTYLVAFMILTDMICNAEIKYLWFYAFPTPHSETGIALIFAWTRKCFGNYSWRVKNQIFLRDSILQRGIGDPALRVSVL